MSARLERLLGAAPGELPDLTPEQEQALADHVADAWHARDEKTLKQVLSLLGVIPDGLVGKVVQKRMPPRFIARIAPHLQADAAGRLVGRLKPPYIADVAHWLDHERVRGVLNAIPDDSIAATAAELARKDDWDTLAAVARQLDDETVVTSLGALPRDRVLADLEQRDPAHRERITALLAA